MNEKIKEEMKENSIIISELKVHRFDEFYGTKFFDIKIKSVCLDTDDLEGILKMVVLMWIMTLQSYCGGWRRMRGSMGDSVFGEWENIREENRIVL